MDIELSLNRAGSLNQPIFKIVETDNIEGKLLISFEDFMLSSECIEGSVCSQLVLPVRCLYR